MSAKEAAIDRFLRAYPHVIAAGREHPALHGCEEVRWSEFAECPAAIPVLLYGLVDQAAAAEAQRVLTNTLVSLVGMNAAVPEVLPYLLRLAVPGRAGLLDRLVVIAGYSEPVDPGSEAITWWLGSDSDHPERERCRDVFARHADVVATLPEELLRPDSRAALRRVAGLL
ncbi:hypothetical protein [Streptomyces indiaensis]|uniref:Uncharacterized protein n=1 Tax=Streptomyces indiaensis TaxID=284033 RepID=A0ABN3DIV8_9ACTN|nr:hypothetical protein [Streptomyces indiaensis]MCF1647918.1 hypothetical protein [Streptomyces indiaensis]